MVHVCFACPLRIEPTRHDTMLLLWLLKYLTTLTTRPRSPLMNIQPFVFQPYVGTPQVCSVFWVGRRVVVVGIGK